MHRQARRRFYSAPSPCTVHKSGTVKPGNETGPAFNTCQHAILASASQGDEPRPAHRVTRIRCPDGFSTASTWSQMLLNITLVNRMHHGTPHAPQPHAGCCRPQTHAPIVKAGPTQHMQHYTLHAHACTHWQHGVRHMLACVHNNILYPKTPDALMPSSYTNRKC
jgi:hypothetical protein